MSANEVIDSGITMPRIAVIEALPSHSLRVVWAEGPRAGREDLVDLRPAVFSYKIYRPLRDEALFLKAALVDDGNAVAWDGEDLVMSADAIEALAQESMSPGDFTAFLARNGLTQEAAAALLGRSRRQIANYCSIGPIPRVIALACYGYEARKRDATTARDRETAA
ncbi:MAG: DUF2442 domain-containing protein [Xanthobacteraceae bacterium]|nr:DUF2442 domain-containing protein [Xanthobacteraceae bacterium]